MNTMTMPARIEGSTTGSVTVNTRLSFEAPRFSPASSSELSIEPIAPDTYR
ncbi:MAG: hypothetical protein BWY81_00628 [Firmicutes bacterium ADurb.Bin467]|nr:MAG: hypothetical protein BWY81_00628 [Firmicutes bacterium ADurb.Bin467]